jgi:hypothetical protein
MLLVWVPNTKLDWNLLSSCAGEMCEQAWQLHSTFQQGMHKNVYPTEVFMLYSFHMNINLRRPGLEKGGEYK